MNYINILKKYYPDIDLLSFTSDELYLKLICIQRQQEILDFVNTDEFRQEIGLYTPKIIQATPNTLIWSTGDKEHLQGNFYIGRPWLATDYFLPMLTKMDIVKEEERFNKDIVKYPIDAMIHFSGIHYSSRFPFIMLDNKNYNTGAGDGYSHFTGVGVSLSNVMNQANGDTTDYTSGNALFTDESRTDGSPNFRGGRGFLPVDTSAIGNGGAVTGANLHIYTEAKNDADGDFWYVCLMAQASTTQLINSDYGAQGFGGITKGSSGKTFASMNVGAMNTIALNATGYGWTNVTGFTKWGLRGDGDVGGNTNQNFVTGFNDMTFSMSENVTSSQRPYFDITFPARAKAAFLYNFI